MSRAGQCSAGQGMQEAAESREERPDNPGKKTVLLGETGGVRRRRSQGHVWSVCVPRKVSLPPARAGRMRAMEMQMQA
jgi:hypothetical protein